MLGKRLFVLTLDQTDSVLTVMSFNDLPDDVVEIPHPSTDGLASLGPDGPRPTPDAIAAALRRFADSTA